MQRKLQPKRRRLLLHEWEEEDDRATAQLQLHVRQQLSAADTAHPEADTAADPKAAGAAAHPMDAATHPTLHMPDAMPVDVVAKRRSLLLRGRPSCLH